MSAVDITQSSRPVSSELAAFLSRPRRMYIGGDWVAAQSGEEMPAVDPATGETATHVPAAGAADVDRAVKAARIALDDPTWADMRPADRERLLLRLADKIEQHAAELAEIESLDNGKTVAMANMVDVPSAVEYIRYMAGWATKIEGATVPVSFPGIPGAKHFVYTVREPVGVVAQIVPWNFPLLMVAWKLAPALAVGCTCILKPAEDTSLSSLRFAELFEEVGFPAGVVNVITGTGAGAGEPLVAHPGVDKVSFTGSTATGRAIGKVCAGQVKRVSLELGGKSPVLILGDADPEQAIAGAAQAIFFNQGEVCTAGSRLYVEEALYDQVVEGVAKIASSLKVGPGWDSETQIGPMVSKRHQERVVRYIEIGKEEGAAVAAGGQPVDSSGFYVSPTVLSEVSLGMRVVQEEIFGPVLAAQRISSDDELAALANATSFGLSASVWSNDLSRVHRLLPKIKAGTVWVNGHNLVDPAVPFGGYGASGLGREHGRSALDLYTETKSVWMVA